MSIGPAYPVAGATTLDAAFFAQDVLTDAEKLLIFVAAKGYTLPIGLVGSQAFAHVVPTAAATVDIQKNDVSIGSVDFALGASVGTFTFSAAVTFAIGDRLQLINQGTADATLADVAVTLRGSL